jgi:transcriptional regulator with XRE-family HTH domain
MGYTQDKVAKLMNYAPRTIWSYENEQNPDAFTIIRFSEIYEEPELIKKYCKEICPIGQRYGYKILDNIDLNLTTILSKLRIEMEEATTVIDNLLSQSINLELEDNIEKFEKEFQEILDVDHNIEILKMRLHEWLNIEKEIQIHNNKCILKKYTK